jgi:serine/threonine protein kinase/formylglycine-generating enzyme required for sulfatase activity
MTYLIGKSLGRYHILEQLGEGGMAVVYKALDTNLEREVAIKVIRADNLAPNILNRVRKRFDREAKALAKLEHANIISIIDYGEEESTPYLVMGYIPGGTLKERLKKKPTPWQEAAKFLAPIARALDYAHKQGIVHRDIKPSNILITKDDQPMLTDFGIARILKSEETLDLTGTGMGVGTPEYMAPEQGLGHKVDHRADIYALGIVLYEMITGRKPFQADTPMAVVIKQINDPLPRPTQFVPDLPKEIEQILLKALAKDPNNRYQSMSEFAMKLEKPRERKSQRKNPPLQKKTGFIWGISTALLTLVALWIGIKKPFSSNPEIISTTVSINPSPSIATNFPSATEIEPTNTNLPTETSTVIPPEKIWVENIIARSNDIPISQEYSFEEASGPWPSITFGETAEFSYEQGLYIMDSREQTFFRWVDGPNFGSDFIWEFDLRMDNFSDPKQFEFGVGFGGDEKRCYFLYNLYTGNQFIESYVTNRGETIWNMVRADEISPTLLSSLDQWHQLTVISLDDQTALLIDGEIISISTCSAIGNGKLSLYVQDKIRVELDNVKIRDISSLAGEVSVDDYIPTSTSQPTSPDTSGLKIGSSIIREKDEMVMMYVPEGEFQMGSNDGDADEKPVHAVFLDAFWIDQTEVTNEMYKKCVDAEECNTVGETYNFSNSEYAEYPVGGVLWEDANSYCKWAGGRLLSEAEWEKASRGNLEGKKFPWGDQDPTCKFDTVNGAQYGSCNGELAVPVASFNPNGYGLYDMAGNVEEWTADWYSDVYYGNSPINNPQGPLEASSGTSRVLRGGAWGKYGGFANALRSAARTKLTMYHATGTVGFRCARDAALQE